MDLNVSEVKNSSSSNNNIKDRENYLSFGSINIDTSLFDTFKSPSQIGNGIYKIYLNNGTMIEVERQLQSAYITALEDGTVEFYGFNSKTNPTNIKGTKKNDKYSFVNCSGIGVDPGEGSDSISIKNSKKVVVTLKDEDKIKDVDTVSYDDNSECYIVGYDGQIISHANSTTEFTFFK